MAAQLGRSFVLAVGNGASPEVFTTIGAAKVTSMRLNGQLVDTTTVDNNGWRELLEGGAVRSVSISLSGIVKDSAAEATLQTNAFAQTIDNYKITTGAGDTFTGAFQITQYERSGEVNGAEEFSATLESSSTITPA